MIIEGKNACLEALKSKKYNIDTIIIDQSLKNGFAKQIIGLVGRDSVIKYIPKVAFSKYTNSLHHQGILMITQEFEYCDFEKLVEKTKNKKCVFMILDGIVDPHNLGSLIRSCECGGIDGIIIGKRRCAQVNETAIKISCGASSYVDISRVTNINDAIRKLKECFVNVYALDMNGESIYDCDLKQSCALIVGGEDSGINELTKKLCDKVLSLPLLGKINSLNASISGAIALYEVVRQRIVK